MVSVSDLSQEQIESIKSWVSEGAQMADVQKRLTEDFGFKVTYMDTRFLSLDLGLEYHVEEVADPEADLEARPEETPEEVPAPVAPLSPSAEFDPAGVPGAEVVATLDQVARPGAMVSGSVTFSDGMKGSWMIDEMGRPSVDPEQAGYRPTEADLISFQGKLKVILDGYV